MDAILVSLTAVVSLVPYFLVALAIFFLGKLVFDWSTPGIEDDKELTERDNPAFGLLFAGYMLGLALAIGSSLLHLGPSALENLRDIATSGVAAILLLRASMAIGNRLILPDFDISREIVKDRNLGAGFAFGGLFVGSGLLIAGVMEGSSANYLLMLRDILVYWAVGQLFLILAWFLFRLVARFDARKEIAERNNAAAGLSLCGLFVAVGIVLKAALTGAGSDLGTELLVTLVVGLVGLVALALARVVAAAVLLPRSRLADELSRQGNTAAGAVSALSYVGVALLFAALVTSQLR